MMEMQSALAAEEEAKSLQPAMPAAKVRATSPEHELPSRATSARASPAMEMMFGRRSPSPDLQPWPEGELGQSHQRPASAPVAAAAAAANGQVPEEGEDGDEDGPLVADEGELGQEWGAPHATDETALDPVYGAIVKRAIAALRSAIQETFGGAAAPNRGDTAWAG